MTRTEELSLDAIVYIARRLTSDQWDELVACGYSRFDADRFAAHRFLTARSGAVVLDGEGSPVVAAGFDFLSPGVSTTWMMHTAALPQHVIDVTRYTRRAIAAVLKGGTVNRVECRSLVGRDHAQRWYRSIGLTFECVRACSGANGEDMAIYVRVADLASELAAA